MNTILSTIQADITTLDVDTIVNAANSSLLGGGGVDGAIHRKAGKDLVAECRLLNGCRTGEAKITKGYQLNCQFIIHTVGPVWIGGTNSEAELLANCYRNSLKLADQHALRSIAFPCISTGIYSFPAEAAAAIAVGTTKEYLRQSMSKIDQIIFCCFSKEDHDRYAALLGTPNTTTLYRPVGAKELALIESSAWKSFPPRLPEQPIFYPVLTEQYAIQIARDWNVPASGCGFVTTFEVHSGFLSRYPVQLAGNSMHRELWIPAEELEEFNQHIVGQIAVIHEFTKHTSNASNEIV